MASATTVRQENARGQAGLQDGIEAVDISVDRGEHEEAHHHLDARQPFTGARQPRYFGNNASRKKGSASPLAKTTIPSTGNLVRADGGCEQSAHEGTHTRERRQRQREAHQQSAEDSALSRRGIQFCQHARRDRRSQTLRAGSGQMRRRSDTESVDQALILSCTTTAGPSASVRMRPSALKRTMMPRQKIVASLMPCAVR